MGDGEEDMVVGAVVVECGEMAPSKRCAAGGWLSIANFGTDGEGRRRYCEGEGGAALCC